ncbi:N-acetylmuramoyl-L-alanine amidase [Xanthomonas bonasiae]|uniref:N-acetylmuramoyl-L-alanine amidase n=1 Tax=Xanthomonas bonasiae TaxID=2810351 RepID=UPI001787176A|nr:N-acetylmuramoyl-L-alanine amidase [Xanthomonas surreyensis]MBD7923732.1 N-acetylmuramoyl-L-alanine amidase [Xanthomonas surreyensis]
MSSTFRSGRYGYLPSICWVLFLGCLAACTCTTSAFAQQDLRTKGPTPVTDNGWKEIQPVLQAELQEFVDSQKRIPGQSSKIDVRVAYNRAENKIIIDLGDGYIPKGMKVFSDKLGDALDEVSRKGHSLVSGILDVELVTLRFNGKSISEIFPEDFPASQNSKKKVTKAATAISPPVVINPGHGIYYHHGYNDWRFQRDTFFGVLEDTTTSTYAQALSTYLLARNSSVVKEVKYTRSMDYMSVDSESNYTMYKMASRYYLKGLYPNEGPTMWNLFPNGTGDPERYNLREQDDDIAARPLYANFINASTLLSIHTNASSDATVRGTTVWVQPDVPVSAQLGNRVLCYMKEQIHSVPGYENFEVAPLVGELNKGENRRAKMPAIIVEVAYHTNADDAAALLDSNFKQAAMRGVEKGFRKQDQPCTPFAITSIPTVTSQFNKTFYTPVVYAGFPTFPLTSKTILDSCTTGWDCSPVTRILYADSGNNTINIDRKCTTYDANPAPATFSGRTTITDGDGVVTAAFNHTYTCSKAAP